MAQPSRKTKPPVPTRRRAEEGHTQRQVELYRAVPVQPVPPSHAPSRPGVAQASLQGILQRMDEGTQAPQNAGNAPLGIQRAAQDAAQEGMQPIGTDVTQAIEAQRGGGRPLPTNVQRNMGQAFGGVEFSGVRVHTGKQANALNNRLQAKAFATGRDIFFRDGAYDPGSQVGQGVLAHELTHTIQQGAVQAAGSRGAGAAGSNAQSGQVQRLAVDDQPYPDLAPTPTLSMRKSSGGAGGVYFATEGNESVVVKLDAPDKAYGAQVANKVTAIGTGLQTSDFRILAPGDPGNRAIKDDILAHTTTDTDPALNNRPVHARLLADGALDAGNNKTAVILMEKMDNVSVMEMAEDPAQHDNMLAALVNPQVLTGFAKLIVADAITGNADRFMKDLAPGTAVPDIPANITNIFLSPDFQSVLAMDNETLRAGRQEQKDSKGNKNAKLEKEWKDKMATVRALLNPTICADLAEVLICAILYTTGDIIPPDDGTVPPNYHLTYIPPTGKMGPLHTKMIQQNVRAQMVAVLSKELPNQVKIVTKTLHDEQKKVMAGYNDAGDAATGGAGRFAGKNRSTAAISDINVVTARVKFLNTARKEKDGAKAQTKGLADAFKHFKRKDKKRK